MKIKGQGLFGVDSKLEDYKNFDDYYIPAKAVATWQYPYLESDYFIAYFKGFKYNIKTGK